SDVCSSDLVILAYNHNDVYGDQGDRIPVPAVDDARSVSRVDKTWRDRFLNVLIGVRDVLYQSNALSLVLMKLNMELKLAGVVVPGTEFDHLINRSHAEHYPG